MSERGERLERLFHEALETPEAARATFLEQADRTDPELARQLRALLRHDAAAEGNRFWHQPATPSDPALGERLGPYEIEAWIGTGGMGHVYRAIRRDDHFEQSVAIKRIKRGMDADEIIARFRTERQILARLEHPNIARLLDGGADSTGLPYLVMEYVDGLPLHEFVKQRNCSVPERLRLFEDICSAVHYAHQRMVIHRDLKPANVLVTSDGLVKLLDFGIARINHGGGSEGWTVEGRQPLSPQYASPEQLRGELVTTASDIYSLGILLYELLTGKLPWDTPRFPGDAANHEPRIETSAVLPRDLATIMESALRADPAQRYASAAELSQEVGRFLRGEPILARGNSFFYLASSLVRRQKFASACLAGLLLALALGFWTTSRAQQRAERRFEDVRSIAHSLVFEYFDELNGLPNSNTIKQRMMRDALTYLDRLAGDSTGDRRIQRDLVEGYVKMGRVQGDAFHENQGDASAALPTVNKAILIGEELTQSDPSSENLAALAAAYKARGNMLNSRGDLSGTEVNWRKSLELLERTQAQGPNSGDLALNISELYWGLGDLYGQPGNANLGRSEEALTFYDRALATSRAILSAQPDKPFARRRVYWALDSLASLELALGRQPAALAHAVEAQARMAKERELQPGNASSLSNLALGHDHLGRVLLAMGQHAKALEQWQTAESLLQKAIETDPKDAGHRRKLSIVECYLALGFEAGHEPQKALSAAERALSRALAVWNLDRANVDAESLVAVAHRRRAEAHFDLLHWPLAAADAQASVTILDRLRHKTPSPFFALSQARASLVLSDVARQTRDFPGGLAAAEAAEKILAVIYPQDPTVLMHRSEWARAEARKSWFQMQLGQPEPASATRLSARKHWGPDEEQRFLLFQDPHEPTATNRWLDDGTVKR